MKKTVLLFSTLLTLGACASNREEQLPACGPYHHCGPAPSQWMQNEPMTMGVDGQSVPRHATWPKPPPPPRDDMADAMADMPMDHGSMDAPPPPAGLNAADQAYLDEMHRMHMQSPRPDQLSGDADQDFLAMMIPHHQAAVEMAETELQYGHNKKVRALAKSIIRSQSREIHTMQGWQK